MQANCALACADAVAPAAGEAMEAPNPAKPESWPSGWPPIDDEGAEHYASSYKAYMELVYERDKRGLKHNEH